METEELEDWESRAHSIVENMADYTVFLPERYRRYLPLIFLDFLTTYIQAPVVYFVFKQKKLTFAAVDEPEWRRLKKQNYGSLYEYCNKQCQLETSGSIGFGYSLYRHEGDYLNLQITNLDLQFERAAEIKHRFDILFRVMRAKDFNFIARKKNFYEVFLDELKRLKFDPKGIKSSPLDADRNLALVQESILLSFENTISAFSEPPMHIKNKDWENIFLICRYPPFTRYFNYRLGLLLTQKQQTELRNRGFSTEDIKQIQVPLPEQKWTEGDAPISSGVTRFIDNSTLGSGVHEDEQARKILEAESILYRFFPGSVNLTLYPIHFAESAFFVLVHVRPSNNRRKSNEKTDKLSGWRSNFIFHERVMRPIADNLRKALRYDYESLLIRVVYGEIQKMANSPKRYNSSDEFFEDLIPQVEKEISSISIYFPFREPSFSKSGLPLGKRSISRSEIEKKYDSHSDYLLPNSVAGISASNFNYLLACISSFDVPKKTGLQLRGLKGILTNPEAISSYLSFTLGRATFLGFFLTNRGRRFPDNRDAVNSNLEVEFAFRNFSACSGLKPVFSGLKGDEPAKEQVLSEAVHRSKMLFLVTLVSSTLKNDGNKDIYKFQDIRNKVTSDARKKLKGSKLFGNSVGWKLDQMEIREGVLSALEMTEKFDVGEQQKIGNSFADELKDAYHNAIEYLAGCESNEYLKIENCIHWVENAWYLDGQNDFADFFRA